MRANSILLSGDVAKKLSGCKVGKSETVTVTINPTRVSDGEIEATITGVNYSGGDEAATPPKKSRGPKALQKAIAMEGY